MAFEDLVHQLTEGAKHLLWGAREEIFNEGVGEAVSAVAEGAEGEEKRHSRRGCLGRLLGVVGTVAGIVALGVLGSPEIIEMVERFAGRPQAAPVILRIDALATFFAALLFVVIISPLVWHDLVENIRRPVWFADCIFSFYCLIAYFPFMLSLLRLGYNRVWGTQASQGGAAMVAMTLASSFFVVGPMIDLLDFQRPFRGCVHMAKTGAIMFAGTVFFLFFAWLAAGHLIRGEF